MESLERVVLNLTGCYEQTVNVYFYLLFVYFMLAHFMSLWQLPEVDKIDYIIIAKMTTNWTC